MNQPFALQIVTRKAMQIQKNTSIESSLTSQEVYDYLEQLVASGHLEPTFENPSEQ